MSPSSITSYCIRPITVACSTRLPIGQDPVRQDFSTSSQEPTLPSTANRRLLRRLPLHSLNVPSSYPAISTPDARPGWFDRPAA